MNRRDFLKATVITLPMFSVLSGCAGPAKYDTTKFGAIQKVGVLTFTENEIEFWADIDRSGNMYSAAGANDSKARRFSKLLKNELKVFYPSFLSAVSTTLHNKRIDSVEISVPRTPSGIASANYTNINEPLLLECKIHIGFVLVKGGIMPSASVFYKLLASDGSVRFEKHLSIGYGKNGGMMETEVIAFPSKIYPDEQFVINHPSEISTDLLNLAEPLGQAAVLLLIQNT